MSVCKAKRQAPNSSELVCFGRLFCGKLVLHKTKQVNGALFAKRFCQQQFG
jgi:hypothetical protein